MNRLLSLLLVLAVLCIVTLGWERLWNARPPPPLEAPHRLVQDYCAARTLQQRERAWEAVLASLDAQATFRNIGLPLEEGLTCALAP